MTIFKHMAFPLLASTALTLTVLSTAAPAYADADDAHLGEIMLVGFNFCPRGWATLNGQVLQINQNQSLYSLLGTTYGGDGRTTFQLPDMRSRTPVHYGSGPGLSTYTLGQKGGAESNTMNATQLPPHTHRAGIRTVIEAPDTALPGGASFTRTPANAYRRGTTPISRFMNPETIYVEPTGLNQPITNIQPVQTLNYCMATQGIFPSRN